MSYFKYLSKINEEASSAEDIIQHGKVNLASFNLHDDLCPDIWNSDMTLKPEIQDRLVEIANDFYGSLDLDDIFVNMENPEKLLKDIYFVGSLASYNYSKYADVDLHLVMDFGELAKNESGRNLIQKYFYKCKNEWNLIHTDLKIKNYDVEVYVQDINETNAANGVYSLMNEKWIKEPDAMNDNMLDRSYIVKKSEDYIEKIESMKKALDDKNITDARLEQIKEKADELWTKIIQNRRESLAAGQGEMVNDNIIFKVLRRTEHLGMLKDIKQSIYDMEMTMNESKKTKMTFKQLKKLIDESICHGVRPNHSLKESHGHYMPKSKDNPYATHDVDQLRDDFVKFIRNDNRFDVEDAEALACLWDYHYGSHMELDELHHKFKRIYGSMREAFEKFNEFESLLPELYDDMLRSGDDPMVSGNYIDLHEATTDDIDDEEDELILPALDEYAANYIRGSYDSDAADGILMDVLAKMGLNKRESHDVCDKLLDGLEPARQVFYKSKHFR